MTNKTILSLFDGISCARVALERAGIPIEKYYASEVDKYAIQIAQKNYPDTIQLGDVKSVYGRETCLVDDTGIKDEPGTMTHIDLLIGGSPCQDLSIAKANRKGLDGDRSGLFWEYVRILNEVKPGYFILENVASMPKEAQYIITKALEVEPIMIDAALVSAQRRKRLFWIGKRVDGIYKQVKIEQPEDRQIFLKDILEDGAGKEKANPLCATDYKGTNEKQFFTKGHRNLVFPNDTVFQYRRTYWRETKGGKVPTLTANMGTGGNNVPYILQTPRSFNKGGKKFDKVPTLSSSSFEHNNKVNGIRKLTPIECERLQCLPDNYTEGVSNTQRYKALGNAFNVDVVTHIIKKIW